MEARTLANVGQACQPGQALASQPGLSRIELDLALEERSAASWLVTVGTAVRAAADRPLTRPSPKPASRRMATERMVAATLRLFSARSSSIR